MKTLFLGFFAILTVTITSCQPQLEPIPVFKNLKLLSTKTAFFSQLDSLAANDPSVLKGRGQTGALFIQFKEHSSIDDITYYGYIIPSYSNNLLTSLTLLFTPLPQPEAVLSFINKEEEYLVYWGRTVNKVLNDLNLKLQISYGKVTIPEHSISARTPNHVYLASQWVKNDLNIKLFQEVDKVDNSNRYPFSNIIIEYSLSQKLLDRIAKTDEGSGRNSSF